MSELSSSELLDSLSHLRVVPVVAGGFSADNSVQLARALLESGVGVMERPLRGEGVEEILEGIRAVRRFVPQMIIGAGTITSPELLAEAFRAGAKFGVSPGAISSELHKEIQSVQLPFIPGVLAQNSLGVDQVADLETAERLFGMGYRTLKYFHAGKSGGPDGVRTFAQALPNVNWVPMGSIEEAGVQSYLDISQVVCCGGSWVASLKLIQEGRWEEIKALAQRAVR